MLIFDLAAQDGLREGVWREYQPGVRVLIRPTSKADIRRLQKEARREGRFDQEKFDRLLADHVVADWEGIVQPDGAKLACTPENKRLLWDRLTVLGNWCADESDRLAEQAALAEGAELGNSAGGRGGRPAAPGKATGSSAATSAG